MYRHVYTPPHKAIKQNPMLLSIHVSTSSIVYWLVSWHLKEEVCGLADVFCSSLMQFWARVHQTLYGPKNLHSKEWYSRTGKESRNYLQDYWQVKTWRKLMFFIKHSKKCLFVFTSTFRDPIWWCTPQTKPVWIGRLPICCGALLFSFCDQFNV